MKKVLKKLRIWSLLLMLAAVTVGVTAVANPTQVEAAAKKLAEDQWETVLYFAERLKGKRTYCLNDKVYYFDKKTGVQQKGWKTIDGYRYYFWNR